MADDENKVEDVSADYIPKDEVREEEEKSVDPMESGSLASIPLPPDNVLRSAFLTAAKYRSVQTALTAYNACVREMTGIEKSQARLGEAQLESQRVIAKLRDADSIHDADEKLRRANQIAATERLNQAEHEAELARLKREMEIKNAQDQHGAFMSSDSTASNKAQSDEDKELEGFMRSRVIKNKDEDVRRVHRVKEKLLKEGNLSEEERTNLDALVDEILKSFEG